MGVIQDNAPDLPNHKMTYPKLRFKDHHWEHQQLWQRVELSQIGSFFRGGTFSKANIRTEGVLQCIHYWELFTVYREAISSVISRTNVAHLPMSVSGDILMPSSDVTPAGLAKASCLLRSGIGLGGDINVFRPNESTDPLFLSFLLNRSTKEILRLVTGTTVKHVHISNLKKLSLMTPTSHGEQSKIWSFLSTINDRIVQLETKLTKLRNYKRDTAEKIFLQEIRFKQDDGNTFPDWQDTTFGDVSEQGKSSHDPWIDAGDLNCIELEHISQRTWRLLGHVSSQHKKSLKRRFAKGDVLFGKLRPYLRKYLKAPFDGVCSTEIWVLTGKKVTNDFLFHLVQSENFITVANVSSGSKMPRADWSVVQACEIAYPSTEEQTKIADFLDAIDSKIETTERTLETLKEYKRGLLQQMFV